MDRNSFNNLLEDLYDMYNPAKKGDIPSLLEKYNGEEFDAVYHLLLKYNYARSENYIAKLNTPETIRSLIKKYSDGERSLKKLSVKEDQVSSEQIIQEKAQQAINQVKQESQDEVRRTIDQVKSEYDQKVNDLLSQIKGSTGQQDTESNTEIYIEIMFDNSELKIIVPNEVGTMAVGTRLVVQDISKKFHGLEVIDVLEDFASFENKRIRTVSVNKT